MFLDSLCAEFSTQLQEQGFETRIVLLTVPLLPKQAANTAKFGRKGIDTKLHNFV